MTESVTNNNIHLQGSMTTRQRIWAIVGASSGNLVEWFDFYVYSFCSLYFAHIFFQVVIQPPSYYRRQGSSPQGF